MQLIYRALARYLVNRPALIQRLYVRARRTPYSHIKARNSEQEYMRRWWLFNPYQNADGTYPKRNWFMRLLPSVRIHEILLADDDEHLHDHPWNAQTIVLEGGYTEEVEAGQYLDGWDTEANQETVSMHRKPGYTGPIRFGQYHRISQLHPYALTLFITFRYQGTWGFLVNGEKVPYKTYFEGLEK